MRGAQTHASFTMKIFVKQKETFKVFITLDLSLPGSKMSMLWPIALKATASRWFIL